MTSAGSEHSSDPSGINGASSASGVAFPVKAVSSSQNDSTFNLSSTDNSVERGRLQRSPESRVGGPQKKARSSTPGNGLGSRGGSVRSDRKVSKPPTPRSRQISKDALAAHNRRMNSSSPAVGGGDEIDEEFVPELPFFMTNGPTSRAAASVVADDAASVARTVYYPIGTPPGGGPPDGGDGDSNGDGDGFGGPPSPGPSGDPEDELMDLDAVLLQQNQQNNTFIKQEQNNQWVINPDGSRLLETQEHLAQQRAGQAASAAAAVAAATTQSAAQQEHFDILNRERAAFSQKEAAWRDSLTAKDTELSRLRLECQMAKTNYASCHDKIEELRAEVSMHISERKTLDIERKTLETSRAQAQAEIARIQALQQAGDERLRGLQGEFKEAQDAVRELTAKSSELQTTVDNMKVHGRSLESQLASARGSEAHYRDVAAKAESSVSALQSEVQSLSVKGLDAKGVADGDAEKERIARYEKAAKTCVQKANETAAKYRAEAAEVKKGAQQEREKLEGLVKFWKDKCNSAGAVGAKRDVLGMAPPSNATTSEELKLLGQLARLQKQVDSDAAAMDALRKQHDIDQENIGIMQDKISRELLSRTARGDGKDGHQPSAAGNGGDGGDGGDDNGDSDVEETSDSDDHSSSSSSGHKHKKKDKKGGKHSKQSKKRSKKDRKDSDSSSSSSSSVSDRAKKKKSKKSKKSKKEKKDGVSDVNAAIASRSEDLPRKTCSMVRDVFAAAERKSKAIEYMKIKEQERIKLPVFPHPGIVKQWFADVTSAALAASGRPDYLVSKFLALSTEVKVPDQDLRHVPEVLISLDRKLQNALISICEDDFQYHVKNLNEVSLRESYQPLSSTTILRLINKHLSTNKSLKAWSSIADFDYLEYKGLHRLEDFKIKFMSIVRDSADELSDSTLCEILLKRIEGKEPALEPDCAAWRRMDEGDPDRNLQWLMKAITRAIELYKSRKIKRTGKTSSLATMFVGEGRKCKCPTQVLRVPPMAVLKAKEISQRKRGTAEIMMVPAMPELTRVRMEPEKRGEAKVKVRQGVLAKVGSISTKKRMSCSKERTLKARRFAFGGTRRGLTESLYAQKETSACIRTMPSAMRTAKSLTLRRPALGQGLRLAARKGAGVTRKTSLASFGRSSVSAGSTISVLLNMRTNRGQGACSVLLTRRASPLPVGPCCSWQRVSMTATIGATERKVPSMTVRSAHVRVLPMVVCLRLPTLRARVSRPWLVVRYVRLRCAAV